MADTKTLKDRLKRLSRTDKVFIVVLFLRLAFPLIGAARGAELSGAALVRFLFIVVAIVFVLRAGPKLLRKVLWRVRHRLIVTWILVGVVPIVLICAFLAAGGYLLLGQLVDYMATKEIQKRTQSVQSAAHELAWSLSHRGSSVTPLKLTEIFVREALETSHLETAAIVRIGHESVSVPDNPPIAEIPAWSKPDFSGLVKTQRRNGDYYLAAHVQLGAAESKTEVFLYQSAPPAFFEALLPGVATISISRRTVTTSAAGVDFQETDEKKPGVFVRASRPSDDPDPNLRTSPPPPRGWWDFPVSWVVLMPNTLLDTGKSEQSFAVVASRPSLIVRNFFGPLGGVASIALVLMIIIAVLFLVVEMVSLVFGVTLTRSITRAVADLYEGTSRVQTGDFSHRIPVRKTEDQLSELGSSFNTMTSRIQNLIVEVKEKERLENELSIARDVQAQLFPKEFPRLQTLELWGVCQPARTVSGDYYDFVSVDDHRVALALGDISGKGISAALLMAHIQSALRSQLMRRTNGNGSPEGAVITAPAAVLSILNDHLYASSAPEKYATFFLALYSDEGGQLMYTNAGHLAPMLVRRGQVQRLPGEGFPVGLFPGVHYDQRAIKLEPGDLLVAFTDGVTETPNGGGEEFGDQHVIELLLKNAEKPLDRIAGEISNAVDVWAGNRERHDDTTLLLARHI